MTRFPATSCLVLLILAAVATAQDLVFVLDGNDNSQSCDGSVSYTPAGVTDVADRCSNAASAKRFAGNTGSLLRMPTSPLTATGDFTISMRIRANAYSGTRYVWSTARSGFDNYLLIGFSSTGVLNFYSGGGSGYNGPTSLTVNTWHHIVLTREGSNHRFYVDGVLRDTISTGTHSYASTDYTIIGQDQDVPGGSLDPNQAWSGDIDDIRIWNTQALTLSAVQALHAETCTTCATPAPPTPNPPPPTPVPIPPTPVPECTCSSALDVDYTSDRIPDALKDAYSSIHLDETKWEVVLSVHNVRHLYHGHVICNKLDTRANVTTAFTPYVSSFDANELWNSNNCSIGALDTPSDSLDIDVVRFDNCTKTYSMTFSLVNASRQSSRCEIITTAEDLNVGCSLTFSSVRAYDLTEPSAFLSAETSFSANLTLPRNLNNEVSNLLYATLAKCNVLNFPELAIDCRIPGNWTFESTFGVSQNIPNWIDATTCVQSQTAVATFVRCGLNNIPVGVYTEAVANVSATVAGTSEVINFSLEYTLPRAASATASASLQNFIISIGMLNEKYYYAGADRATLYIHVFDTARLEITQLDMFNANGQSYALRDYNQFQLSETSNASHFIIEFRPSAIRQDSNFYRNGPHGVNVSFLFTAASGRRMSTQDVGYVQFDNINVRGPEGAAAAAEGEGDTNTGATSSSNLTVIVAAAAAGLVVLVAGIAGFVIAAKKRSAGSAEPTAAANECPPEPGTAVVVEESNV